MKTKAFSSRSAFIAGLLGSAILSPGFAASESAPSSRVDVTFVEPEHFTDASDSHGGSDHGRDGVLAELKTYLQEHAKAYLPKGAKLSVKITDVDLAGEFEPWRGPSAMDVRIVKEIYAPRINLSYQVVDASGTPIKQGERVLTNMNFLQTASPATVNDPRRHEKALIDDWIRSEFGSLKKSAPPSS